jgi:hypothetical protein
MKRFRAALTLATLLGSTTAWTSGCGKGTTEAAADASPRFAGVAYVEYGWLLPDASADVLAIADANARQAAFARAAWPVKRSFLVPRATFEWLFKQAAKARRLEERPDVP